MFSMLLGGVLQTAESQVAPVAEDCIFSATVEAKDIACNKVVLSRAGETLIAKYLVQNTPFYNNYNGYVGDYRLSSSNTDLRQDVNQLASWLIVVDVSDPKGRSKAILQSAAVATRLVSLMSPQSNVRILAMAGSQQLVGASDVPGSPLSDIMTEGKEIEPIFVPGRKGQPVFENPLYQAIVTGIVGSSVKNSNTNLWIGLARALKEQMPDCSRGIYQYLPRGVILISDGADESRSSESDFQDLVKTAKDMGVPIHTIGFPFKDSSRNETERFKGFAAMQRLAVQTDGSFLSSDEVSGTESPDAVKSLVNMLRKTSAAVMQLKTNIDDLPVSHSLKLELMDGQKRRCDLELHQEDLGLVIADRALENMLAVKQAHANAKTSEERATHARTITSIFVSRLMPLTALDKLFDGTSQDRDYARRVKTLLLHIKKTEGLSKKPDFLAEVAEYLTNPDAALPEAVKESQNIVVNTHNTNEVKNSANSAALAEEEQTSGLVWWVLGIGGASACVIVFLLLIRAMSKDEEDSAVVINGENGHASGASAMAYLDDAKQLGQNWPVLKPSVTVGRSRSADITLPSGHVSKIHFTLYRGASGQWMIKDANSTNGTEVNGRLISAATPIHNGDSIVLADMQLTFRAQ